VEEEMPKDPANNIDRYKIDGGELNEYEFQSNQEEFSEPPSETPENLIPGTPPEVKRSGNCKQSSGSCSKTSEETGRDDD
jgi:hypothetical protein